MTGRDSARSFVLDIGLAGIAVTDQVDRQQPAAPAQSPEDVAPQIGLP
jgi:hypothetical protein